MASVFTKIIQGELPARFVFQDEHCVAFLSISPLRPGHTLVVPRVEIAHFIDVPSMLFQHLATVSQHIGRAISKVFPCTKVGMMIAGLEVSHVHIHLVPIDDSSDLNFDQVNTQPLAQELDQAAEKIRTALQKMDENDK